VFKESVFKFLLLMQHDLVRVWYLFYRVNRVWDIREIRARC